MNKDITSSLKGDMRGSSSPSKGETRGSTITVTSPLLPDLDEFNEMLKDIWASKWITNMGQFHVQL